MEPMDKGAVFITGAASGIGRETALFFDKAGYRVFAGVRNAEAGTILRSETSSKLIPIIIDITSPQEIAEAANAVSAILGHNKGIQCLINNAGIVVGGPLEFLKIEDFRYQIEVNLIGQLAVTQAFLPLIRKAKGRIIFVGSIAGLFALPFSGPYAASKFGLEGMADALRRELDSWKIPVILVEPGSVKTPLWQKSFSDGDKRFSDMGTEAHTLYQEQRTAIEKMMRSGLKNGILPEDVAKVILMAMEKKNPRTRYQVGKDARMAALGMFVPDAIKDWFIRNILKGKIPMALMGW
jgi:NAD(P)-dependent dehydrogenase (short-subunit alcohol dehydrogenase family)